MGIERKIIIKRGLAMAVSALALETAACGQGDQVPRDQIRPAPVAERFSREYYRQTYGADVRNQYAAACADFAVSAALAGVRADELNRYGQYSSVDTDSEYRRLVEVAGKAGTVRDALEAANPEINNHGQCGDNALRALRIAGLE